MECNSDVSKAVRNGDLEHHETQSSIVVTANEDEWFLFNASPIRFTNIKK